MNEPFVTDLKDASFQSGAIARFTSAPGQLQRFFTTTLDTMILGVTPTTNLFLMAKQILASGEWRVTGPCPYAGACRKDLLASKVPRSSWYLKTNNMWKKI